MFLILGVLDGLGYINKIEGGVMKVCTGSMVVVKGDKMNGLYHFLGETLTGSVTKNSKIGNRKIE